MEKTILVPPDGGYGWIIVLASAMNNFLSIPLIQNFGMIFKNQFSLLGISATQVSVIINLNGAFGMLMGLFNGTLLTNFGYRKISLLAASLTMLGVVSTAYSHTFAAFLISYGILVSLGNGLNMSSYNLAMNTYFSKNKTRAVGISQTLTAFGPIIMPQVIYFLLLNYTVEGATLILGGIFAHGFVTALLLQPVKRHMNKVVVKNLTTIEEENEEHSDEETIIVVKEKQSCNNDGEQKVKLIRSVSQADTQKLRQRKKSTISINYDQESGGITGLDSTLGGSMISLESIKHKRIWKKSFSSDNQENSEDIKQHQKELSSFKKICLNIVQTMDLNLLKDPIYVSIMLGISLAIFAELNFAILTPFILSDFGLDTAQTATFLSTFGTADIIFRFLAPYIGDFLKYPPRVMYSLTLLILIVTRFALTLSTQYQYLLCMAVILGSAKGIRAVYIPIIIPDYVPLDRLAAASGIQMMVNGFITLVGGPILGIIRDSTGSYIQCIYLMNCVTFSTIVLWSIECFYVKYRGKSNEEEKEGNPS